MKFQLDEIDRKIIRFMYENCGEDRWAHFGFNPICSDIEMPRNLVRLSCRKLTRYGLLEFRKGLWSEDGEPAGAGYGITKIGMDFAIKAMADGEI